VVYFSRSIDQVGLFTQDVAGMRLAASVACRDWQPAPAPASGPVLGVPEGLYLQKAEPAGLEAFRSQVAQLAAAGVTVKQIPTLEDIDALRARHLNLVFAEFAQAHASFYATYASLYRPRTAEIVEKGRRVNAAELAEGRESTVALRQHLEETMDRARIDLWVCPAAPGPAPLGIQATGDPIMALPWTHAGMPAITVPAGCAPNGLPLGLQLVARCGQDEQLLAWAAVLQPLLAAGFFS
jgi:Asp-tRNA(Asn)/Glu-tRNA(Gln) amidotransferase A subunit family amidase